MFRYLLVVGTSLLLPFATLAEQDDISSVPTPSFRQLTVFKEFAPTKVIQFHAEDGEPMQILSSHASHIPRAQLGHVLEEIPGGVHRDVLFSYSEDLQPIVNESASFFKRFQNRFLIPLQEHYTKSTHEDRIGVLILTINTLYDSFIWIHAGNLSVQQKSAMILFNVMLAASIGYKKELWSNMTRPLGTRISQFLAYVTRKAGTTTQLAGTFLSYLTFSVAIQTVRVSILSADNLIHAMGTLSFWGPSIALGTLMTVTSLGWNEQLAKIDQKEHPIAKRFFQRIMEMRGLLMGTIAPSGKLLQPHTYGYFPIAATVIHGAIGLFILLRSDRIINWIENSSSFQRFYTYHEKLDRWIHGRFKPREKENAASCEVLFN